MATTTSFVPSTHGLHFTNNDWPDVEHFSIVIEFLGQEYEIPVGSAGDGMCGGMAFAAIDYFRAGRLPPDDTNPPGAGVLYNYIVERLYDSFNIPGGVFRYLTLMSSLTPSDEALAPASHGRPYIMIEEEWPKIRSEIDNGRPVTIGLIQTLSNDPMALGQHHQVVVYGYDVQGDDLSLYVYNPNDPDNDGLRLELDMSDPAQPVTANYNVADKPTVYCFFVPDYSYKTPPPLSPPRVSLPTGLATESGQQLTIQATIRDPDVPDTHSATWDIDTRAGSITPDSPVLPGSGGDPTVRTTSYPQTWHQSGTYTARITVRDAHGNRHTAQTEVLVRNVAPVIGPITLSPASPEEGQTMSAHAPFRDEDYEDDHDATWHWGDGSSSDAAVTGHDGNIPFGQALAAKTYGQSGAYTVRLQIDDHHGHVVESSRVVQVRNVPPMADSLDHQPLVPWPSQEVSIEALFHDRGWLDQHTSNVDWGDQTPQEAGDLIETNDPPAARITVTAQHHYAVPGTYPLRVRVTDQDGASAEISTSLRVELSPDMPGMADTNNETTFLTWTGGLAGSVGDAKNDWRTGGGSASRWWIYEADGWLYFFRETAGDVLGYDPTSTEDPPRNYLAIAARRDRFIRWISPDRGDLEPWITQRIAESREHVFALLRQLPDG